LNFLGYKELILIQLQHQEILLPVTLIPGVSALTVYHRLWQMWDRLKTKQQKKSKPNKNNKKKKQNKRASNTRGRL
jgi:hypothetical protein